MTLLDYRTAGESHGAGLLALIEGLPAGLAIEPSVIDAALARRQGGYGRSGRMALESDHAEVLSGLRHGLTLGSPVAIEIRNRDQRIDSAGPVHRPRPGHADLAGAAKWLTTDCRNVLERASARETAARVAAGAVAAQLLEPFGIQIAGYVVQIGRVQADIQGSGTLDERRRLRDSNEVYCPDGAAAAAMVSAIRQAKEDRDTLGGMVEVMATGLPPGLGSCMRWQDKLDGRLMAAVGSIQAIKAVEIGAGFAAAGLPGSAVHDEIDYDASRAGDTSLGFVRRSNRAGGLEGGMTNGMPLVLRAAMKPISTLARGMDSVNLETLQPERSDYERSDVCAVPAASVVAEYVVAFEVARAFLAKFGGDTLNEVLAAYEHYLSAARAVFGRGTQSSQNEK